MKSNIEILCDILSKYTGEEITVDNKCISIGDAVQKIEVAIINGGGNFSGGNINRDTDYVWVYAYENTTFDLTYGWLGTNKQYYDYSYDEVNWKPLNDTDQLKIKADSGFYIRLNDNFTGSFKTNSGYGFVGSDGLFALGGQWVNELPNKGNYGNIFSKSEGDFNQLSYNKLKYIEGNFGVVSSLYNLFRSCKELIELPYFEVSTKPSSMEMFAYGCEKVTYVPQYDFSNMNGSAWVAFEGMKQLEYMPPLTFKGVTNLQRTFSQLPMLTELYLDLINVPAKNANQCFQSCENLQRIVGNWSFQNLEDMRYMFTNCFSLQRMPSFDTSKVKQWEWAFANCWNLVQDNGVMFDLDMSAIQGNAAYMIRENGNLEELNIYNFGKNGGVVTSLTDAFSACYKLARINTNGYPIGAQNMSRLLSMCSSLVECPELDFSNAKDMVDCFYNCEQLTYIPLIDSVNIEDMVQAFIYCGKVREINFTSTAKCEKFDATFSCCYSLQKINRLDFTSVTNNNLQRTFENCDNLTSIGFEGAFNFNGRLNLPHKLDYASVKLALECANRTSNLENTSKSISFGGNEITDNNGEISNLIAECMGKGWNIYDITLN